MALFATCYCNRNEPEIDEDLAAVFQHNGIPVAVIPQERCCGMPKLELGDLESIEKAKSVNIPAMAAMVDQGYDIVAPDPVLRADVQAGTAADVSRTTRRCRR